MSEWKDYRLGELLKIKYGKDHKKLKEGNIPVYGSGGIMRMGDEFLSDKPSVLIPRKGTLSNIFYVDVPFWTVDTMFWSEINDTIVIPKYLYYAIKDLKWDSMNVGSAVPSLTVPVIESVTVTLPSLSEQKKIAAQLSEIDSKIECNRKICANLEAQAQALFKHWFIDFAPFKEGKFVESELGRIPEGWRVYQFPDFISPSGEKVGEEGIPEYSVTNTGIHPRDEKFKKNLSKSSSKNKLLRKFDLVFGMSREILNWGVMEYDFGGVSPAYHIFRVDQNKVNSIYLKEYISHKIYYFKDLIRASTREGQSLDKGALFNKCIYVPPTSILNDFFSIWNLLKIEITNLQAESSRLSLLRDTLLPKLMSGQIKL